MKVENTEGVLITSISKKVPLIQAVRNASVQLNAFKTIHGYDINPESIGHYFVDTYWPSKPLDVLTKKEILNYCKTHNIGAIIPTRDGELPYFAKLKKYFAENGIAVLISNLDAINICFDKFLFYETLCQWGLPAIPTYSSFDEVPEEKQVVKERYGSGTRFTGLNLSPEEAKRFSGKILEPIYQPYIAGKEYSIDLYRSAKGEIIGCVTRCRDYIAEGESKISTTVDKPDIEALCQHLVHRLDAYGPVVVQGIEQEDGEFLIIECNPRFGGASSLSIAAGLDVFSYFFQEILGQEVTSSQFHKSSAPLRLVRYPQDMVVLWK